MLPKDMRRETVGISGGPKLGVSKKIDLAVSLLERLHDPEFFNPAPPRDDFVDAVACRMPQRDLVIAGDMDRHASDVAGFAVHDRDRRRSDVPDEASGDGSHQGMIDVSLPPDRFGPALSFQEERIDAIALRR